MISAADREKAVELIDEAVSNGASCQKACERLGLTERTYYRWKRRKIKIDSYKCRTYQRTNPTDLPKAGTCNNAAAGATIRQWIAHERRYYVSHLVSAWNYTIE